MANIGKYTTVQFSVASVTRNESIWVEAMIAPLTDRSGEGFPLAVSQSPDKQLKKVSDLFRPGLLLALALSYKRRTENHDHQLLTEQENYRGNHDHYFRSHLCKQQ